MKANSDPQYTPPPLPPALNAQLLEASDRGQVQKVKSLLAQGADVNCRGQDGRTPLGNCLYHDHTRKVEPSRAKVVITVRTILSFFSS